MEQKVTERIAVVESRLDQHDARLNAHSKKIDSLTAQNIKQDSLLEKLCVNQDKNNEMTNDIHSAVKLIKWIVTGIPAVIGLYIALKQIGVF